MPETPAITMYGADWCSDCRRAKALLDALEIDYEYVDVELSKDAADQARALSGRSSIPVISFPDGTHQVEPSNAELHAKLVSIGAAQ